VIRRRRLPHIDAIGRPNFITFRLYDSLPKNRQFPNLTSGQAFAARDRLLDFAQSGPMFLKQPEIANLIVDSVERGAELGHYDLHACCIMANHVHLLLTPAASITKLTRSLKSATAAKANALLGRTGQPFWQDESFDRIVRTDDEFRRITRYMENNPVRAGLAAAPEDYVWSSARRAEAPPQA
jgi:putative transposase